MALRDDEKPRLVQDLGDRTYLMLRNQGLLRLLLGACDDAWVDSRQLAPARLRANLDRARRLEDVHREEGVGD